MELVWILTRVMYSTGETTGIVGVFSSKEKMMIAAKAWFEGEKNIEDAGNEVIIISGDEKLIGEVWGLDRALIENEWTVL